jgi:hypothetical protein
MRHKPGRKRNVLSVRLRWLEDAENDLGELKRWRHRKIIEKIVRLEVLTEVGLKSSTFRDITPCISLKIN